MRNNQASIKIYAYQYRECERKEYNSALVLAETTEEAYEKFKSKAEEYGLEVDWRTFKWSGDSIPLALGDDVLFIEGTLDGKAHT